MQWPTVTIISIWVSGSTFTNCAMIILFKNVGGNEHPLHYYKQGEYFLDHQIHHPFHEQYKPMNQYCCALLVP